MILYLDSSALVKIYVREEGTPEVRQAVTQAQYVGTSQITKVEVPSALMKLSRLHILDSGTAQTYLKLFLEQWPDFSSLALTNEVTERALRLVMHYPLRGFDAVHLATALVWQDLIGHQITFATFDKQLWRAAAKTNLSPFPVDIVQG